MRPKYREFSWEHPLMLYWSRKTGVHPALAWEMKDEICGVGVWAGLLVMFSWPGLSTIHDYFRIFTCVLFVASIALPLSTLVSRRKRLARLAQTEQLDELLGYLQEKFSVSEDVLSNGLYWTGDMPTNCTHWLRHRAFKIIKAEHAEVGDVLKTDAEQSRKEFREDWKVFTELGLIEGGHAGFFEWAKKEFEKEQTATTTS